MFKLKVKSVTQKMMSSLAYLSSSYGTFFYKSSISLWEQTVPLFLPIFFYSTMRMTLYKNLSMTKKIQTLQPLIYAKDLDIQETTGTDFPASFPDIYLTFDTNGQHSPDYDKRDDFNFVIIKFPHLDSICIPTAPANRVYISQLVRYARACSLYSDFQQCHRILSTKLLR